MLTVLYMLLDGIVGMGITLAGYALCVAAYFFLCFLFRCNRMGKRKVFFGWLACELLCDVLWYLIYYPNGSYVNYGLGGATGSLLLPAALAAAGVLVAAINQEKYSDKR